MSHRSTTYRAPSPLQVVVDGVNTAALVMTIVAIISMPVLMVLAIAGGVAHV